MSNMTLDDLMEFLAGRGSFSLSRTRFPTSASPHLRNTPVLWRGELRIPGYMTDAGQPYFSAAAVSARAAAEDCHAQAEAYLSSSEGRQARERYVADHQARLIRFQEATGSATSGHNPIRHPGPLVPDVTSPDAPSLADESIL